MIWAIVIAVLILLFAVFLFEIGAHVFEDDHTFKLAIGVFFALFIVAVILLKIYLPKPAENADFGTITNTIIQQ